jgi:hypothetical protein
MAPNKDGSTCATAGDRSADRAMSAQAQARPSFLKKRSKRLLRAVADLSGIVYTWNKSFLVLFSKKNCFLRVLSGSAGMSKWKRLAPI